MELTISYLLKAAITLCLLYLFYFGLLRTQGHFRFNRTYLLLAPLVAISLPFIQWSATLSPETAVGGVLQAIQLNEVVITSSQLNATQSAASYFSVTVILWVLYATGAGILVLKLLRQLWQVQLLKRQAIASYTIQGNVQVYQLADYQATFAFGNAIFLGKPSQLSAADQDKILAHELAHVKLLHSWDILYYEILTALLWFNPFIWLLKQELRDVHEYQADAEVLQKYPYADYSNLLSRVALQHMGLPIGSYFQKPQVLKRLQMLQSGEQKNGWLRPLLILPVLSVLLFVFSIQAGAQVADTVTSLPDKISDPALPEQTSGAPEQEVIQPEPIKEETIEETQVQQQPGTTETPAETSESEPTFTEVVENDPPAALSEEKPFTYVEQMPQFVGGDTELLKYLSMNIRYPEKARLEGAEGLVVVGFTVNENGSLQDIQVIRSIEESIDAEAIRVVQQMNGKWTAGKQNGKAVRVNYTLPVRFNIK